MNAADTDAIRWIEAHLDVAPCADASTFYEGMPSQSARSLPLLYQPFDASDRAHWIDRGACFDFLATAGRGRLLDFGPGDGWPSLLVAPFVQEVVGVDAAPGLVAIQRENAKRLGIDNVTFHRIEAGAPLPFDDETFDGAMAASSLEQTADPKATLAEIRRVLKPGGRLRTSYEALSRYAGGNDRHLWIQERVDGHTSLFLSRFRVDEERSRQCRLVVGLSAEDLRARLPAPCTYADLTPERLEGLREAVLDARACTLTHPSGPTWARWMKEVGFADVAGTHGGQPFARSLFDALPATRRPPDLACVDALLRDVVPIVATLVAPLETDPRLTATR